MESTLQRIGLIAGAGEVPVYFAKKAREQGLQVVSVSLTDAIGERRAPYVEENHNINIGQVGKMRKALEAAEIQGLMILGKVEKSMIFRLQMFDFEALKMLRSLKSNQDRSVMMTIIQEVEKRGVPVLDQKRLMPELFPARGVLTRTPPPKKALEDAHFALPIARSMADQEIGQTLVVKNRTVIAVEAMEGTDETIKRGCALAHGGCTVVKVSRTDQDYRFDAPGVGPRTVEHLIHGKASLLALEAGRVMIIERERVLELADKAGLAIVCL